MAEQMLMKEVSKLFRGGGGKTEEEIAQEAQEKELQKQIEKQQKEKEKKEEGMYILLKRCRLYYNYDPSKQSPNNLKDFIFTDELQRNKTCV